MTVPENTWPDSQEGAVSDAHYSGSRWLAGFTSYLETRRGISQE